MPERRTCWFPAKRYGWGWGFPASWQGRIVLAVYALLAAAGVIVIAPAASGRTAATQFVACVFA